MKNLQVFSKFSDENIDTLIKDQEPDHKEIIIYFLYEIRQNEDTDDESKLSGKENESSNDDENDEEEDEYVDIFTDILSLLVLKKKEKMSP